MTKKPVILFMSDWADSGFGTVGKALCSRLADMEVFDINYLGWHATPQDVAVAASAKIRLFTTQFWNASDQFGKHSFNPIVEKLRPDVVITLGDPWMVDHVQSSSMRKSFTWLSYMPIDRDVISKPWVSMMKDPDCLVVFSEFGKQIVDAQIPFRNARLILHGVDKMVFKPWYPEGMDENTDTETLLKAKKSLVLGKGFGEKFIVGFVGRNQVRKAIPRTFKAFKAFNCKTWVNREDINITNPKTGEITETVNANEFCREKQCFRCDICPAFQQRPETENSILYLHTQRGDGKDVHSQPGIGWRIDEIAHRHSLNGRVGITPGADAVHGLPREAVAQIMGCFDVHLFLSHSEGFGLPIAESILCGVPTLVTNYSSMPEIVSGGGGVAINVRDYDTYVTWENEWANADIGHAADEVEKIFSDKLHREALRKAAKNNSYIPDWGKVALQFRELIFESLG